MNTTLNFLVFFFSLIFRHLSQSYFSFRLIFGNKFGFFTVAIHLQNVFYFGSDKIIHTYLGMERSVNNYKIFFVIFSIRLTSMRKGKHSKHEKKLRFCVPFTKYTNEKHFGSRVNIVNNKRMKNVYTYMYGKHNKK